MANSSDLSTDIVIQHSPDDSVADLQFSPQAETLLAAASWDGTLQIYDVHRTGREKDVARFGHEGPVLSCCWSSDGQRVFSAGVDRSIRMFDLGAGDPQHQTAQISAAHDDPIRSIQPFIFNNTQMLITGSWDKTILYWDLRQQSPVASVTCKDRVYSMAVRNSSLLAVATANRWIQIIDLKNPTTIFQTTLSPLKHQTRVVAPFLDGAGYAIGGVEGRCAFQYISPEHASKNYSFKCHRNAVSSSNTNVYAINAISVHPVYGTFSTAGSDGTFHFWDRERRLRLKGYGNVGGPITATGFSKTGGVFAYAVGYDWSQGYMRSKREDECRIVLKRVGEDECKPRARR